MHPMNVVCDETERFSNVSLKSTEQHVDPRDMRINRDNADVKNSLNASHLQDMLTIYKNIMAQI